MKANDGHCVLIWPPYTRASTSHLPLGIPSLSAYLTSNGVRDLRVADVNTAYLKTNRYFWFIRRLQLRYPNLAKLVSQGIRKTGRGSTKGVVQESGTGQVQTHGVGVRGVPFWRRIFSWVFLPLVLRVKRSLEETDARVRNAIPESVEAIVTCATEESQRTHEKLLRDVLRSEVMKDRPGLVGISVIYPEQLFFALIVSKLLREELGKDVDIVLGGAQITKHIERLSTSEKVYDLVDFLITNDGEEPLLKLIQALPERRFSDIPNLYYRKPGEGREFCRSSETFSLRPKDYPVPDFAGFDMRDYLEIMPLLATKGCYWSRCSFCTYSVMHGRSFYGGSVEGVLQAMMALKGKYGVSTFDLEVVPEIRTAC